MRTLLLVAALAAPAHAQGAFRAGGDFVAGNHQSRGASSGLALGGAAVLAARTPGAVAAYGALRPELTVVTEGGTGFVQDRDVLYYGDDGLPVYGGGSCVSVATGEPAPGSCGAGVVRAALGVEAGARLAVQGGAALLGVGLRSGAGGGVYGAVTGQLASPAYGRVEVGTGHVMVGLGFGRL